MSNANRLDLTHDLFLPTLLFAALGGMTWAVRGCSGFGAAAGCLFAGVTWGAAWWFIARDPAREQSRRYASGWIILAVTLGVGLSGARGWMQWPSFFEGRLSTDFELGEFVPISRAYGFLWLFIAGVPWAGIGACLLAWTGSLRTTRWWHWMIRIACGLGMAYLARGLFDNHHDWFLPLYDSLGTRYENADRGGLDPNLARLIGDCGSALTHLGLYLGLLAYEAGCAAYRQIRAELPDWKNPLLILTVGLINGLGWALCQNWSWAHAVWPNIKFNWWRCWESSGGLSMGIAYGIAYFLVNRRMSDKERTVAASQVSIEGPNFEWLLVFLGLAFYAYIAPFTVAVTRGQMGAGAPFTPVPSSLASHLPAGWTPFFTNLGSSIPGRWAALYFAVMLLFGGIYYCLYRPKTSEYLSAKAGLPRFLDSIVAGLLTLLLTASLFVSEYRLRQGAKTIGLTEATLSYNRFLRDHRHAPWIGKFLASIQITQFALLYVEIVAGILLALGLVWYLINSKRFGEETKVGTPADGDPNLERFGLYLGLLFGLGLSIRNGLKGWFNIYCEKPDQYWTRFFLDHFGVQGDENYWSRILWYYLGPSFLLLLMALVAWILWRPLPRKGRVNPFPHAYGLIWLVLIVQNVIALLITGPLTDRNELAFAIYYIVLFAVTAIITVHFQSLKAPRAPSTQPVPLGQATFQS